MNKDALIVDLVILRKEISGISPKLSIYPKLRAREAEILKQIGHDPYIERRKILKENESRIKKARHKGPDGGGPTPSQVRFKKADWCSVKKCKRLSESLGSDIHGVQRRQKYCTVHLKELRNTKV